MRLLGSSWLHYTQRGKAGFASDSDCARNESLYNGLAVNENSQQKPSAESSPRSDGEPMLFCPVCSRRLAERKCKLYCEQCGYYMSCADYY
jgi:hypothetical protein